MNKNSKILIAVVLIAIILMLALIYLSEKKIDSTGLVEIEVFEEKPLPPPFYKSDNPERNEKVYNALYKEVVDQRVRILVANEETPEFDEMFFVLSEQVSVLHRVMQKNYDYVESKISLDEIPKNSPIFLLAIEGESGETRETEAIEIVWLDWSQSGVQ